MQGLVNRAIEAMAIEAGGQECWDEIRSKVGLDKPSFLSMKSYPDCMTYRLVAAASETLGLSANEILYRFGKHWILFTAKEGYGSLLELTGSDLETFLSNLNRMHQQVGAMMPGMTPPRFSIDKLEGGILQIHYHSERKGLAPMVVGLLAGLGERFDVEMEVTHVSRVDDGADHDIFEMAPVLERVESA